MALEAYETKDGAEIVTPSEVPSGKDVYCKSCRARMRVWKTHTRKDGTVVIRHFKHPPDRTTGKDAGGCSGGGEGDPHLRAKSIAVETLGEFYKDGVATSEESFKLSWCFEKQTRTADAVVTFSEPHPTLGAGIVVEIQDKHHDKDVFSTTEAYLSKGYSVCWLTVDSFGKHSLKYNKTEFENLVANDFPDSTSVFDADLNPDGTAPNKDVYPLAAPVWPHAVEVARATQLGVSTGWSYNAYYTDGDGRSYLQAEPDVLKRHIEPMPPREVHLPIEFYEECARRFYRDTPWLSLFKAEEWNPRTVQRQFGQLAKLNEIDVKIPLPRWLSDEDMGLVVGDVDVDGGANIIPIHDVSVYNPRNLVELDESQMAFFADVGTIRDLKVNPEFRLLVSVDGQRVTLKNLEWHLSSATIWSESPWHKLFHQPSRFRYSNPDEDRSTPRGTVPFGRWISDVDENSGLWKSLKRAYEKGRWNMPESTKKKNDAMERVPRIIEYNTGGPQRDSIYRGTIKSIGTQAGLNSNAVDWAIEQLVIDGALEQVGQNRYRRVEEPTNVPR